MVLTATLLILLIGAVAVALVTSRTIVGAVPGRSPILGLATTEAGFLAGTGRGAFWSRDGKTWSALEALTGSRTLVADGPEVALVLARGVLWRTTDLVTLTNPREVGRAIVVADESAEAAYVVKDSREALRLSEGGSQKITFSGGPTEIIALAVGSNPRSLFAGGLTSGVWMSRDEGATWRRLVQTPTRAILLDPSRKGRILIGTSGGILISEDEGRRWRFTGMREPVEALAESDGRFFALSLDRLLYTSADGVSWARVDQ